MNNQKTKITESVIGGFLIIWGIFTLGLTIWLIKQQLDLALSYIDVHPKDISIFKLIKNNHFPILTSLLTIFGGITLILNKKIGWTISILISVVDLVSIILFLWSNDEQTNTPSNFYILIGSSLIFMTIIGTLLSKPMRNKYEPKKETWLIVFISFSLLFTFKLLTK